MDDRAESASKLEMARLDDDFNHILVNNTVPLDATWLHLISTSLVPRYSHRFKTSTVPSREGVNSEVQEDVIAVSFEFNDELDLDLVHPAAISELKNIADRLIRSGFEKKCCLVYSSVRSRVLDECLRILGIEEYCIEEVQKMEWTTLYGQMEKWNQALKILVKWLLTGEKFLCEQVFAESESMREVCFVESAKGCVMKILNFGKAVANYKRSSENLIRIIDTFDAAAIGKGSSENLFRIFTDDVAICERSPEKLFTILDSYDALSGVMPDLEELFNGDSGAGEMVCSDAKCVLDGLCEAAIGTFGEFERAVCEKTPALRMPENGDIHPLTRYVMDYVKLLVDYSEILNGVLEKTCYNSEQLQSDGVDNVERMPFITLRLLSLIKSLESNLEEKSRMYKDVGLQCVFLMNNILYIVNKLKDPEVRNMLGNECISKRRDQIRQCAVGYLRVSWTKAFNFLWPREWTEPENYDSDAEEANIKVRVLFKKFNAYFEDTYRIQTAWKIADPQLREELRILISEKLVPLYSRVLRQYSPVITVKYTADNLSTYLWDLFEGTPCTIQTTEKNLPKKIWLCLFS